MTSSNKLILGTVQFGLDYGISNPGGKVLRNEVVKILDFARAAGIEILDTASAYGEAEEVIGEYHSNQSPFLINTKFDKMNPVNWENSIQTSLMKLKIQRVNAVMFHSFQAYSQQKENLPEITTKGKEKYFDKIGVSIYTNTELEQLLYDKNIEIVQLPFNLLDNESVKGDLLRKLRAEGKVVHVRSVFLQGLFYKKTEDVPGYLQSLVPDLILLQEIAERNEIPMNSLALQYVNSKDYIDGILIGVDNRLQLEKNIQALNYSIDQDVFSVIDKIKVENTELLNPATWQIEK